MTHTILITGATDGIGLATAKTLVKLGHTVLLHGRSETKLTTAKLQVIDINHKAVVDTFCADLADLKQVSVLADEVRAKHPVVHVLINNAGIFKTAQPLTQDGFDSRFMVNTIAPFLLTQKLLRSIPVTGRIINLSSAAQAPVNAMELTQTGMFSDSLAYAKSKLAITMWSRHLAKKLGESGPVVVAVNPASMLGSKMVQNAYGVSGGDIQIGADVLVKAALSDEFATATGRYFDNDIGAFAQPHPDALDIEKCRLIAEKIEYLITKKVGVV